MAADRGAFIDQSQSLNVHMAEANMAKLSSMHFHGWQIGLKTGMYYLRTKAAASAIQFTVDKTKLKITKSTKTEDKKVTFEVDKEKDVDVKDNQGYAASSEVLSSDAIEEKKKYEEAKLMCSLQNKDDCLMCGS